MTTAAHFLKHTTFNLDSEYHVDIVHDHIEVLNFKFF